MSILEGRPELALRLGTKKALVRGVRVTLADEPILRGGRALIPLCALGDMRPQSVVTVNGTDYADGVVGAYINLDSMGLIMLDSDPEVLAINHGEHKSYMMNVMADMLFDIERVDMKGGYAPATEEQRAAFVRIGNDIRARLAERGAKHPVAFSSDEIFNELKSVYTAGESKARSYLERVVAWAEKLSSDDNLRLNEDESDLATPLARKEEADGYDVGGRHASAEQYCSTAMQLAFAYRVTGKQLFAKQAYYIVRAVAKFEHFGPGHFLNCAQAACFLATTYDWLVEAWRELKFDTGAIKRALYEKCIYEGWRSAIEDKCSYPSAKQGSGWRFKAKPDNWNAVCNGGLIVAALVLLTEDDGVLTGEQLEVTTELIGASLASISQADLVLSQYAPDGSYVESNSYWSYGTTALFRAIAVLYDALGTDLGLSLSGGIDKTCYYAVSSESCDYVGWNYHDGSLSRQDTSIFNMLATVSGDATLYALRESQLERGKSPTVFDMLYHPTVRGRAVPELSALPLDYYMEGIDAFVVRSGWAAGSLYAGIMGGYNPKGGSHNQIDSGSFVYHNGGVLWFTDMGSDNYNISGGYFGNYRLYRRCAEGNNVLCLPSIDYGQGMDCTGKIVRRHSGKNAFAVIDNGSVYEDKVSTARRGMLLTPNRRTLVIQDEVSFVQPTDACFVAHFNSAEITADLADNGKSCILTHKDGESIKVTLSCDGGVLTVRDCYDFLLPTTASFEGERDRSEYSRLVVEHRGATELRCAFVIEPLDCNGYPALIPMDEWDEK